MKRKIFNIVSVFILTLIILSFNIMPVFAVSEFCLVPDLMSLTGADSGVITANSTGATFTNADYADVFFLSSDMGSGYLDTSTDSFSVDFALKITDISGGTSDTVGINTWSNQITTDWFGMVYSPKKECISVELQKSASGFRLCVWEVETDAGTNHGSAWIDLTDFVQYYCRYIFDHSYGSYGIHYLYVYSDEAHTNQVGYCARQLYHTHTFQYYQLLTGYGYSGNGIMSGTIQDICFSPDISTPPEIETIDSVYIDYIPESEYFSVDISGNLTDNGGGCTVSFYYSDDQITYEQVWSNDNGDGTYNGTIYLPLGQQGNTFYYYAYAMNGAGESSGTERSFILEASESDIPTVYTIPIFDTTETISSNTTVYGSIWNDGGENCTGFFYYKTITTENWTISSNTTNLQSGDTFSYTIIGIPEDIYMMYMASAVNTQGSDNGSVSYFVWENSYSPTCITNMPLNVTSDCVTFSGNVTDSGGGYCIAGFDYRKQGSSTWNRIIISGSYSTNQTFTSTLCGLLPLTVYEYKALVANQATQNPVTKEYTYVQGNTVVFATSSELGIPVVILNSVEYWDDYTVTCEVYLSDDGDSPCKINMQYRPKYGTWLSSTTADVTDVLTGQTVDTYISGLSYGITYEFRATASNTILIDDVMYGAISYSNVISYFLKNPTDTTTSNTTADDEVRELIGGWNTESGRFLLVIAVCIGVLFVCIAVGFVNHIMPIMMITASLIDGLVIAYGMLYGYIPVFASAVVICVFAVIIAVAVVRIFKGSKGGEVE